MTERIKLTEDNFILQWIPQTDDSYIKIVGIDSMSRNALIKQILDDYDIVSNLGVNPRQLIQEWKEKAEKYDACGNIINQVNELLQENKQLKEENEKYSLYFEHNDKREVNVLETTYQAFNRYRKENQILKQKLEKIRINVKCWDNNSDRIREQIKEILEEK